MHMCFRKDGRKRRALLSITASFSPANKSAPKSKNLFLTAYVDKITVFFDDRVALFAIARRVCVYALQTRCLKFMWISLRCLELLLDNNKGRADIDMVCDMAKTTKTPLDLSGCWSHDMRHSDPRWVHDPVCQPGEALLRDGELSRRNRVEVLRAEYTGRLDLDPTFRIHCVLDPDRDAELVYLELKTRLLGLQWCPGVPTDLELRGGRPTRRYRPSEDGFSRLQSLRQGFGCTVAEGAVTKALQT